MALMTDPGRNARAITTSDSTEYNGIRGIYVGASGNVALKFHPDDSAVTLTDLAAGVVHPLSPVIIMSTGTTATGIVAVY